jgi:GTPase
MKTINELLTEFKSHDYLALARILTIVENELPASAEILSEIQINNLARVIGITGPPGAGKSTLVNAILEQLLTSGYKTAVLAVDPTSPLNFGSILGDRIRMSHHFNHPNVFIRSVATRGSLGGLSAKIIEMVDVIRAFGFDYILVETVGVGQSEIEIAGLADITLVVLVPEAGDEIQHIKSGIMEIGDAFIVNKSDLVGADAFAQNLEKILHQRPRHTPVFRVVSSRGTGIDKLVDWVGSAEAITNEKKLYLYTEKAFKLIQQSRMKDISKSELQDYIAKHYEMPGFSLYKAVAKFIE